jgi:hypothetical protein
MSKGVGKTRRGTGAFRWDKRKEEAALALANDELTDEQIAERAGVCRAALCLWKQNPDFAARVESYVNEFRRRVRARGIAILERRVASLDDRWSRMHRLMTERADAPEMKAVAGGSTGLLAHDVKAIGSGPLAEKVDVYTFDAALMKEIRETERQAAQELSQWTEKHEHMGKGGGPIDTRTTHVIDYDQIRRDLEAIARGGSNGNGSAHRRIAPDGNGKPVHSSDAN